jgi:hypothetical protein
MEKGGDLREGKLVEELCGEGGFWHEVERGGAGGQLDSSLILTARRYESYCNCTDFD